MHLKTRLPPDQRRCGFFLQIPLRKNVNLTTLPNLGLFAVFDRPPAPLSDASRLFIAHSPGELARKLRRLIANGLVRSSRVFVETAASETDFTDPMREDLLWTVLAGIERLKARGDRQALLRVRAALERKNSRPGPRRQAYAAKWKIETLQNLAKGLPLEQAVTHAARKRALESARQELWRYCREFYQWCLLANLHNPDDWRRPKAAQQFREDFGLEFPRDLEAAREAYKRGKRTVDKHLAACDRFLASGKPSPR